MARFRVNSQNEIREPDLIAMLRMTTLALAPIAVRFPPKSAPIASDHHRASACTGSAMPWVSWSTTGLMAAVQGMLSTTPLREAETSKISSVVVSGAANVGRQDLGDQEGNRRDTQARTSKVTGAISSTVVTLSKRAEATAVISTTPAKGELPCC
jgi:hypothetical protein